MARFEVASKSTKYRYSMRLSIKPTATEVGGRKAEVVKAGRWKPQAAPSIRQ